MEERRRAWNQVNHYTDKVVKDLLLEQKRPKVEEYLYLKKYHEHMVKGEQKEKKRIGDSYMKDSFHINNLESITDNAEETESNRNYHNDSSKRNEDLD